MTAEPDQSLRRALDAEIHSRPYETLDTPLQASHLALGSGEDAEDERAALRALCARFEVKPPAPADSFFAAQLGTVKMRWERHTEFSTYTFYRPGSFAEPFVNTAIDAVPADVLNMLPGERMVAAHIAFETVSADSRPREDGAAIAVEPLLPRDRMLALFGIDNVAAAEVSSSGSQVYSDFRIHEDGFTRFYVAACGLQGRRTGRLCRRLLEIETYRMMALLGVPVARTISPVVTRADLRLGEIMNSMRREEDAEGDDVLLDRLTDLAAEVEAAVSQNAYRFGASRAYHAIVRKRIAELRENRVEGLQKIAEFMDRRLEPAMATCLSAEARLESLSVRVSRASQLLRTRVDVKLEQQNRKVLEGMARNAKRQLRLQQVVETVSTVAITYYAVSLIAYFLKAAKPVLGQSGVDLAIAASVPVMFVAIRLSIRTAKKKLGLDEGD